MHDHPFQWERHLLLINNDVEHPLYVNLNDRNSLIAQAEDTIRREMSVEYINRGQELTGGLFKSLMENEKSEEDWI